MPLYLLLFALGFLVTGSVGMAKCAGLVIAEIRDPVFEPSERWMAMVAAGVVCCWLAALVSAALLSYALWGNL